MDRDHVIETLQKLFATEAATVACAYLFGSVARGEHKHGSDVDVAVLFHEAPPNTLLGPVAELQDKLERNLAINVDLVELNHAGPDLVHRVLRDGVLVCEHDANKRVRFEVKLRNEYFDLLPYLEEYRKGRVS
jgi:predicted nucleotidyltransferase